MNWLGNGVVGSAMAAEVPASSTDTYGAPGYSGVDGNLSDSEVSYDNYGAPGYSGTDGNASDSTVSYNSYGAPGYSGVDGNPSDSQVSYDNYGAPGYSGTDGNASDSTVSYNNYGAPGYSGVDGNPSDSQVSYNNYGAPGYSSDVSDTGEYSDAYQEFAYENGLDLPASVPVPEYQTYTQVVAINSSGSPDDRNVAPNSSGSPDDRDAAEQAAQQAFSAQPVQYETRTYRASILPGWQLSRPLRGIIQRRPGSSSSLNRSNATISILATSRQ